MRAAIYCRVSTEDQAEAKTIENQVEFAQRYCSLNEIPIHDFYLDDGITGTIPLERRPQGTRLLKDAGLAKFDAVLVYRLDRMARSTRHLLNAYDQLAEMGVVFKSMTEPFDTSTGIGTFVMTLLGSIAALERDTIVERTSLGRDRAVRNGKWPGGSPPYGYQIDESGCLQVHDQEAEVIRLIFDLYAQGGMGTVPLADYLNGHNIPTAWQSRGKPSASGARWDAGRLSEILNNPVYKGVFEYRKNGKNGKKQITVDVPCIVTLDSWDAIQRLLRKNFVEATRNSKRFYLLKGLIRCVQCGSTYVGDGSSRQDQSYVYYRCTGNSSWRGKSLPRCSSKAIRADHLEAIVWHDVKQFVENPEPIMALLEQRMKEHISEEEPIESEVSKIETMVAEKHAERERIIALYRKQLITEAEVEKELLHLRRQSEALGHRKEMLLSRREHDSALATRTINARLLLEELGRRVDGANHQSRRDLVTALVDHVLVTTIEENGKKRHEVTVTYCFDPPSPSLDCSGNGLDAHNPETLFTIVETEEGRHNFENQFTVYRTENGGGTWTRQTEGLPGGSNVKLGVLRHGMCADTFDPCGVYVGTNTGQLFASNNRGDSWELIADFLPPIYSVRTAVIP